MGTNNRTRAGLLTAAAIGTLSLTVLGGTAAANAANGPISPTPGTSSTTGTSSGPLSRSHHPAEEALTGDTAAKVKAAVEAKYPGVTIDRMEKDADGTSVYEAHITKADGTHATVMLNASFAITGEATMPGKGMGGSGRGGHGLGRPAEEALTGDTAAKVKAAVEAKYPGVTIDRMEKDADGTSVYEAHITKADGTHATVMLDASFAITGEATMPGKGGHGRGGHGAPGASQSGTTGGAAA